MRLKGLISPLGLIRHLLLSLAFVGTGVVFAQLPPRWGSSPFELTVEPVAVMADHIDVRVALSFSPKHVVYSETFQVLAGDKGAVLEGLQVPLPQQKPDPFEPSKQVGVYAHPFETVWRLSPRRDNARLQVGYKGCDDKVCFMPQTHMFRFDATSGRFVEAEEQAAVTDAEPSWLAQRSVKTAGGYLSVAEFLSFLDQAEGKPQSTGSSALSGFLRDPVSFFHAQGMLLTLLLVLVGGVLLNLTPCVLPMIPINLAIIGAGAGTRNRGFLLGAAYGAGMVLVYGGLGWGLLRSGLFFGALQSSPWFNLTVALVFVALALALFGLFVIDVAQWVGPKGGNRRQGVIAAFSAGTLSALLAGACVAPVVLAVLLLAGSLYAGGSSMAQFLPFVLGLGMALPWPFAGAGLSVLPRPGLWMVRVKQAFGVFLLLLAAYYGHLAWVGFAPTSQVVREGSIKAGDRAAWKSKVAQARSEGKPLFVDFWATWCKNCTVMERTTFADPRVKARLAGYVVVKVQSEKPDQSPAKEMLAAFDVRGLPGFVVLK
jgi:thiol:disulfide interchange protein